MYFVSTSRLFASSLVKNGAFRKAATLAQPSAHQKIAWKIALGVGSVVTVTFIGVNIALLDSSEEKKKKIVILGTGWAGISFLRSLKPGVYDVSIVSPTNYFLFTPLLPGVTVGTVEGRSIIEPVRKIIAKKHRNGAAHFYEAECMQVDVEKNRVMCADTSEVTGKEAEFTLDYDYLVMAVGAETATFNIKGVKENTHYLKTVQDAHKIRKNIVDSFESAVIPGQTDEEVKRLLHFVVVGGGPTGVEFAAELYDFVQEDLKKFYPHELLEKSKITLVDGLDKVLNSYSEEISHYTHDRFHKQGIHLATRTFVTQVDTTEMKLMDAQTKETRQMPYGMCVWAAGLAARPITRQIMQQVAEQTNRVGLLTEGHLRVKNSSNIFALGDCSTIQYCKLKEHVDALYNDEGIDHDLTDEQFVDLLYVGMKKHPQLCHHFKEIKTLHDSNALNLDDERLLTREDFHKLASMADAKQTSLPPTAQVADQEGEYLGDLFNKHEAELSSGELRSVPPFKYNHLGSFAYVGENRAVLELPLIGSFKGCSAMFMWRGAYASNCVSARMRSLVLFDWIKTKVFGRDMSRI